MKTRTHGLRYSAASALGAGLFLLASAHAHAKPFTQGTTGQYGDSFGNSDVHAGLTVFSGETAQEYTAFSHRYRTGTSQAYLSTAAQLFGIAITPLFANSSTLARVDRYLPTGADTYTQSATGTVIVLNKILYSVNNDPACSTATLGCVAFNRSLSQTLLRADATFWLGPVPISVSGRLVGSMHGGLNGTAAAPTYLGKAGSIFANVRSDLNSGAAVSARFSGGVGIEDVAGFGITTSFALISADFVPVARVRAGITDTSATAGWGNSAALRLSTMDGSASLWGSLWPLGTLETEIVSWSGYSFDVATLYDYSGGQTW